MEQFLFLISVLLFMGCLLSSCKDTKDAAVADNPENVQMAEEKVIQDYEEE